MNLARQPISFSSWLILTKSPVLHFQSLKLNQLKPSTNGVKLGKRLLLFIPSLSHKKTHSSIADLFTGHPQHGTTKIQLAWIWQAIPHWMGNHQVLLGHRQTWPPFTVPPTRTKNALEQFSQTSWQPLHHHSRRQCTTKKLLHQIPHKITTLRIQQQLQIHT